MRARTRGVLGTLLLVCLMALWSAADAAELRVVDSGGLVRAVRIVRGKARVVIVFQPGGKSTGGECVATNVDGLATERHASVSAQGECTFTEMSEGSWQINVPGDRKWRAQIYE